VGPRRAAKSGRTRRQTRRPRRRRTKSQIFVAHPGAAVTLMIRSVCFLPQLQAEAIVGTLSKAIISITADRAAPAQLRGDYCDLLRLSVDDAYEEKHAIELGDIPDMAIDGQPLRVFGELWPDAALAQRVHHFLERLHNAEREIDLIVHCHAGMSRSAAVAVHVHEHYGVPFLQNNRIDLKRANPRIYRLLRKVSRCSPIVRGRLMHPAGRDMLVETASPPS
jgi:predicted protein tyrosine phosphatase